MRWNVGEGRITADTKRLPFSNGFAAQWLAYTFTHRRFADVLTVACARIRGDVDCYSFIAVDFHHILLAGFSRRTHFHFSPSMHGVVLGSGTKKRTSQKKFIRRVWRHWPALLEARAKVHAARPCTRRA
jgi:hypothetical protein